MYSVVVILLSLLALCQAQSSNVSFTPDIILRVSARNISQACINRYSVVVNGSTPGPQITLVEGQTTWIRVYNDLEADNTTIHYHGLDVNPAFDGSSISQWPITPGHFFDYAVRPPYGSAGSFFWHSHNAGMQATTVHGPLIVKDAGKVPYRYNDERVILISDQFNRSDADMEQGLIANPFKWSGEVSNVLINGRSAVPNVTVGNSSCSLAEIRVSYNTTYRLRFISATVLSFVVFGFSDNSNMSIIEADGAYTKPYSTKFIQLGGGQRHSVLWQSLDQATVEANRAKNITKYYIQYKSLDRPAVFQSYAIIKYPEPGEDFGKPTYEVFPPVPPLTLPNTSTTDYPLAPLHTSPNYPKLSDVTRRVYIKVQQVVNGTTIWYQNGFPWTPIDTPVPYFVSLLDPTADSAYLPNFALAASNGGIDNKTRAFPAQMGEVLEIVILNTGSSPAGGLDSHPFHAHGHHYWDIGSGPGSYDAEANEKRIVDSGREPITRDSSMLFRYGLNTTAKADAGWRAWRLRVESPGAWLIHCHTLPHMIMGMSTAWVFGGPDDIRALGPLPVTGLTTYGGDVVANVSHIPGVPG